MCDQMISLNDVPVSYDEAPDHFMAICPHGQCFVPKAGKVSDGRATWLVLHPGSGTDTKVMVLTDQQRLVPVWDYKVMTGIEGGSKK